MASIYHKKYTQALPTSAEIFEKDGQKWARWEGRGGVTRMGRLRPGGTRVEMETKTWVARYRDGEGRRREVSTGCRDKAAARQVLADLVKRAEQVRAGIITPQQARTADHADVPVSEHVAAYLQHLEVKTVRGKRVSEHHRKNVRGQLRRLLQECHYHKLADITRESMERWMARAEKTGMAARTRNTYRAAIVAFCNWCVETDRLAANPLDGLCKADVRSDRRRVRRALTEGEIVRLLKAARLRPVATYGRETEPLPPDEREGSSTWQYKDLAYGTLEAAYERGRETLQDSPEFLARKEWRGRERALIYRTLVLTGLRRGELESITVGQVRLDAERPHLELLAGDSKSGRGALIPLREDLAGDIADWLEEKLVRLRDEAREAEEPIPSRLPFDEPLFYVPSGLINIFNRDIAAADIPKEDERGRTVDIHALRHTFGTHLSKAGVAPRTAQAAMRHSTIDLTMNIYTDPRLLDVAEAVEALPELGISDTDRPPQSRPKKQRQSPNPRILPPPNCSEAKKSAFKKCQNDGSILGHSLP